MMTVNDAGKVNKLQELHDKCVTLFNTFLNFDDILEFSPDRIWFVIATVDI